MEVAKAGHLGSAAKKQLLAKPPTSLGEALAAPFRYVFSCGVPLALLFSVAPTFLFIWLGVKALSIFTPQARRLFNVFDEFMWSSYQRVILFFAENWTQTEIYLYGDAGNLSDGSLPSRENTVFICNHQCSFDWIIADVVAVRHGCLGNLRYVLKNSLRYIPMYGYYFKQHGCVYVKRGGYDANSYRDQLLQLARQGLFWLVIFPEGTRFRVNNKKALEVNRNYADKHGLPTFDYVLTPKHRGFYHAVQSLGANLDAIYDVTVAYEPPNWFPDGNQPKTPSMASYLTGSAGRVHIHMAKIPRSTIPNEEHNFAGWLCDRFKIKNDMLQKFYKNGGALDGNRRPQPSQLAPFRHTLPYLIVSVGLTVLLVATDTGRSIYKWSAIAGTVATMAWVTLVPDRWQ